MHFVAEKLNALCRKITETGIKVLDSFNAAVLLHHP
jgi:hypothetical protein